MNDIGSAIKSASQQVQDAGNKADEATENGGLAVQKTVDHALDKAASKADEVRSQAVPMIDKMSDQARKLMQQGRDAMQDTTQMLKERATQATEQAVGYTKDEPIKALLIAASAGALLMCLVTMLGHSRD